MAHGTVIQGYFRGGRAPVLQAALPAGRVVQAKAPLPFAATGGKPATVAGPKVIAPPPVRFPGQKPASAQAKPAPVAPAQALSRFTVPLPKLALQAKPATIAPRVVQLRDGGEAFAVPSTLNLSNPGGGRPLPAPVREKMESFFGTSFADVRVHVGPQASSIGALAFTHGSNLYFAPGQYNPNTAHGQQLLGHELTHVVQQRAGRVKNPFGSGVAVVQDRELEAEAERMGARAAAPDLMSLRAHPGQQIPRSFSRPVAQRFRYRTSSEVSEEARPIERLAHKGMMILSISNYNLLNKELIYLWLVVKDESGKEEIIVAPLGTDRIGHPTLAAKISKDNRGRETLTYKPTLIGGEMRYGNNLTQSGWILDNESGRFGRTSNRTETPGALKYALALFKRATNQTAYGDLLSGAGWKRRLQRWRKDYSLNYLSLGYQ